MKKKNGVLYAVSAIVLLCVCEWFFFRKMYGSALLFGDTGDGRLTMLITEHWYHVFRGLRPIRWDTLISCLALA